AEGNEVIVAHGNGPQVGMIQEAMTQLTRSDPEKYIPCPLSVCVAMSQGYIGYHLQQSLQNELHQRGMEKDVVTTVTQVVVDPSDPAFENPTKPVGDFYTKEQAAQIEQEKGYTFVEDAGRGYRQVVPSPLPKRIVELNSIETLIENGTLVIAAGGGGVPVVEEGGALTGVPAVIDKDRSSALLADNVDADQLIILTAVDYVYINYNQPDEQKLTELSQAQAQELIDAGQFPAGSMLPKIQACLSFVKDHPERKAIITSLAGLDQALEGKLGTVIHG
ncbi:MAG: carbamate kinase, partial [Limosilactobacillus fermentum]